MARRGTATGSITPSSQTHHTHDVGQNGSRGTDERSNDGQQVVVQQEALGAQGPARVTVQHGDHHRHVGASDSCGQRHTLKEERAVS